MPKDASVPEAKLEYYRILNRDQCRDLPIPRKNYSPVRQLSEGEWRKICMLADATEKKQQQEAEKSKKQEREHMENDYLNRKAEFDKMEAEQHYDPVQAEINREKAEKSQQLRTQVATEKLENDDTVRFFNHCLNDALVRAVRDRQVLKNEEIKQIAEQEQFRVDNACQKDANLGFIIGQKIEEYRHEADSRYGQLLKDQLKAREEERLLDKEAANVEGRHALEYARRMQQKEVEDGIREYNEKKYMTKRLLADNYKSLDKRKEARLNKIRMDIALAQTLKEKNDMLDKREAEVKEKRKKREADLVSGLLQHKRLTDMKSIEDEKRAQRAVFQADREWRRKELSKALKDARDKGELKKVIEYQRETKIRKDARDMQEARGMFADAQERLVKEAAEAEEKRMAHLKRLRADAAELRKQIAHREKERWSSVQVKWSEGAQIRQELQAHDEQVAAYMQDKMEKAESAKIPHGYMMDIKRHMTNAGYLPKPENPHQKLKNIDHITTLIKHWE